MAEKIEKKFPDMQTYLSQSESMLTPIEYIAMSLAASSVFLIFIFIVSLMALKFGMNIFMLFVISLIITIFVLMQQLTYPKLLGSRRIREIERNLLPVLQDILVQLNSGIPLFNILVNISQGNYGEIAVEIGKAVRKINAGISQVDALEEIALKNPSVLFRRAIWQIVNGMKEGADISSLLTDVLRAVGDEQTMQIQKYGGQLSPLALFYLLIAVIAPSLGVTFIIILSSFLSLSELTTKMVFYGILGFTFFFQIMFLGLIKTRRPTLM